MNCLSHQYVVFFNLDCLPFFIIIHACIMSNLLQYLTWNFSCPRRDQFFRDQPLEHRPHHPLHVLFCPGNWKTEVDTIILAHQTRFSAIFTCDEKSYLTYPYPTRGVDKKRITTRVVQHIGCIGSNSVFKMLGVVIVTSHTTSTFNMADINV